MDTRPQLEREVDRIKRVIGLVGAAWLLACGGSAAWIALRLTRPKEPPC